MADNLKIEVEFGGKGSQALTSEMDKLQASLNKLVKQMELYEDAGKKNTASYKIMQAEARKLEKEIGSLSKTYVNGEKSTSLFRDKAVNLGADLTILSFGVRSVISDVGDMGAELNKTNPSMTALAGSAAQATVSLLAMVPALKAIGVAGALATGAVATFVAGVVLMGNTVRDGVKGLIEFIEVLKGTKDMASAMDAHISRLTFGILDLGNATDEFDSAEFEQQLSNIAYLSQFAANNLADMKNKVADMITFAHVRFKESGLILDPTSDEVNDETVRKQRRELESAHKRTRGTGTTPKQEKKEELDFLAQLRKKIDELTAEIASLTEQKGRENLLDYEKIRIQDELIKKQEELNELTKIGVDLQKQTAFGGVTQLFGGNAMIRSNRSSKEEMEESETAMKQLQLEYVSQMSSEFMNMLNITGLMQSQFGQIVQLIASIINGVNSGFNFLSSLGSLIGLIPGVGVVGSAVTAIASNAGGMPINGYGAQGGAGKMMPIVIQGTAKEYFEYNVVRRGTEQATQVGGKTL